MIDNFSKLGLYFLRIRTVQKYNVYKKDATLVTSELDIYNWFYYFDPFEREIFSKTINNICESLKRNPRKIYIVLVLILCFMM